jgi:hypothetical protein
MAKKTVQLGAKAYALARAISKETGENTKQVTLKAIEELYMKIFYSDYGDFSYTEGFHNPHKARKTRSFGRDPLPSELPENDPLLR